MRSAILLLFVLIISLPAGPQALAAAAAPPAKVARFTLLNDLNIVLCPVSGEEFQLRLVLQGGPVSDPAGKEGLAWLAGMHLAATVESNLDVALLGTSGVARPAITVEAARDSLTLIVAGSRNLLNPAAGSIYDALINPRFQENTFQELRQRARQAAEPLVRPLDAIAGDAWRRMVFSPFPYCQEMTGTPESLSAIQLEDLIRYHQRCVMPNRSLLILGGNFGERECRAFCSRHWGRWVKSDAPRPEFAPARPSTRLKAGWVQSPDPEKSYLILGAEGLRRKDDDAPASSLLARLLEIRLRLVLAGRPGYECRVFSRCYQFSGEFTMELAGPGDPDLSLLTLIRQEIHRTAQGGFSAAEFRQVVQSELDDYLARSGQISAFLPFLAENELYRQGDRFLYHYPKVLEGVIKEDLSYLAEKILDPSRLNILLVSPRRPEPAQWPADMQPAAEATPAQRF